MKAIIQRVNYARVKVEGEIKGEIGKGFLILLGVEKGDDRADAEYMAEKCTGLRIFEDENGKMNLPLSEVGGKILAISNFTLCGDCRKGKRPSFINAELPNEANELYEYFVRQCRARGIETETGVFRAHMHVELENNGPVTLIVDSREANLSGMPIRKGMK
ncbi:MAG: D-tyrosyl-tRNA(Tyr) deacylase [Clostridiales bacterium]|nr:D-tyrosyl-tRNA(Tyr) deacylase [Clostridiales bacterium]